MPTKPTKKQGHTEIKTTYSYNNVEKETVWLVPTPQGTKSYENEASYNSKWDTFSSAWDECQAVVEAIKKCQEMSQMTAVIYSTIEGSNESISYTQNNLQSAVNYIQDGVESNLDQAKKLIGDFKTELDSPLKSGNDLLSGLEEINNALGTIGSDLTTYHNSTVYPAYTKACSAVGENIQKFME